MESKYTKASFQVNSTYIESRHYEVVSKGKHFMLLLRPFRLNLPGKIIKQCIYFNKSHIKTLTSHTAYNVGIMVCSQYTTEPDRNTPITYNIQQWPTLTSASTK